MHVQHLFFPTSQGLQALHENMRCSHVALARTARHPEILWFQDSSWAKDVNNADQHPQEGQRGNAASSAFHDFAMAPIGLRLHVPKYCRLPASYEEFLVIQPQWRRQLACSTMTNQNPKSQKADLFLTCQARYKIQSARGHIQC